MRSVIKSSRAISHVAASTAFSEAWLHVTELLGGWPGAFLAQRRLRHKVSKCGYQFVFWLIVLAYQFAAVDSFQNWRYTHAALSYIERISDHRR